MQHYFGLFSTTASRTALTLDSCFVLRAPMFFLLQIYCNIEKPRVRDMQILKILKMMANWMNYDMLFP